MDIFKKVKELNLPIGKYVVFGGASLEARGIRKANDIDIMVFPEIAEDLKRKGSFKIKTWSNSGIYLFNDIFEIGPNSSGKILRLIKTAEIINGVPFTSLQEEIRYKKAKGRKKDFNDIKLIEKYLHRKDGN